MKLPSRKRPRRRSYRIGKKLNDDWISRNRGELLSKENAAEKRIEALLTGLELNFTREAPVKTKNIYFIDFLVSYNLCQVAIEVDGSGHFGMRAQAADRKRESDIMKDGTATSFIRIGWRVSLAISPDELLNAIRWSSAFKGSVLMIR